MSFVYTTFFCNYISDKKISKTYCFFEIINLNL